MSYAVFQKDAARART